MKRWMLLLLLLLLLVVDFNHVLTLPAPSTVSMESVNMRHTLMWHPPQTACDTTVLYSIQFQGEFELMVLNGSWVDAHECQQLPQTHCDLTYDLGSDSDYNLRVRAQCGTQISPWAKLSPPFNRRDTVLTVPNMSLSVVGDALQVTFDKLPLTAFVNVTVWKRGSEQQASVYTVAAEQRILHIAALQETAVYCVAAQTVLNTQIRSRSTNTQCVPITGPDAPWKSPTTVAVTVLLMVGVLLAALCCIRLCRPDACRKYFHKEPLPRSLQPGWEIKTLISVPEVDVHMPVFVGGSNDLRCGDDLKDICENQHLRQPLAPAPGHGANPCCQQMNGGVHPKKDSKEQET